MSKKAWQTTPGPIATGLRSIKTSRVTRLDLRIVPGSDLMLHWQSRLVISLLSEQNKMIPGYAASQQFRIKFRKVISGNLQFVVFHVEDWDNRIYLYEPGLYYDFNFQVYYGSGQKISSVLAVKVGRKLTLSVKASMLTYHDRDYSGSGNEMILGNKKWEGKLQFRLTL